VKGSLSCSGKSTQTGNKEESMSNLEGMTWDKWCRMSEAERAALRSGAGLTKQLIGLEGWRVEVVEMWGEKKRFIVGRSTGWSPCHICISTRRSIGGMGASREYMSVRKLYWAGR
jgi:hypothetical protein